MATDRQLCSTLKSLAAASLRASSYDDEALSSRALMHRIYE